ncbi:MAG: SO2930 family diheme c-type cytochrome [Hyphomonas sp.]|nr:SO2930 family diheme c-type cytochrome [Hyphomonas sp.]
MRFAALLLAALVAGLAAACGLARGGGPNMGVILAETPARNLSAYGLFADIRSASPASGVVPYDLVNPLFSDHAEKHRFVFVPGGAAAVYDDTDVFAFPVGTVLVKTFAFAPDMRTPDAGAYRVETRLLIRKESGWAAFPYIWNADGTEAEYAPIGGRRTIETISPSGAPLTINYAVPNQNQCKTCHQAGAAIAPIGPKARNLNHHGQLEDWVARGVLDQLPAGAPAAIAPFDVALPLDARARAWLDINCAHCHKPDGSASNSGLVLSATETDPVKVGIGKRPVAAGRGAGTLFQVIVPGAPDRSILAYRMTSTEPGVAMPELGRSLHDPDGLALVREWIAAMETE